MFGKFLIVAVLVVTTFVLANAQNKKKPIILDTRAIVNGKARVLPKPVYPEIAEALCVGGKVKVEVLIDMIGDVKEAKAVSGDELLYETSVEAPKKAKFHPALITTNQPYIFQGFVVYNFDSFVKRKCIESGILNKKSISLPKPLIHPQLKIKEETEIKVRVLIDALEGKVVSAHTFTGHPLMRGVFEAAARKATFSPFLHGQGIFVKGVIIYKVKPDRTVSTDIKKQKKN